MPDQSSANRRWSLALRAEVAAAQAEQHDPRNDGTDVMWQRATAYALLAAVPGHGGTVDPAALECPDGQMPATVADRLPEPPRAEGDSV